jgi:hypothetical protein
MKQFWQGFSFMDVFFRYFVYFYMMYMIYDVFN